MSIYDRTMAFLNFRSRAYRLKFPRPHADDVVLRDLATFCRAFETTVIPGEPEKTLILQGRREVWLRIMEHLNIPVDQLYELYGGVRPPSTSEERRND